MKQLPAWFLILSLFIAGCNSGGADNTPEKVLMNFFNALSQKNIEKAKRYVTDDSEGMINMMQMSLKNMDAPDAGDQFNPDKITFGKAVIGDEEAHIPVTEKASGETVNFFLKKEKGKWKVAFDLATIAKMAKQKMEKEDPPSAEDSPEIKQIMKEGKDFQKHLQGVTDSLKKELKAN